jgi:hypothetical protein
MELSKAAEHFVVETKGQVKDNFSTEEVSSA